MLTSELQNLHLRRNNDTQPQKRCCKPVACLGLSQRTGSARVLAFFRRSEWRLWLSIIATGGRRPWSHWAQQHTTNWPSSLVTRSERRRPAAFPHICHQQAILFLNIVNNVILSVVRCIVDETALKRASAIATVVSSGCAWPGDTASSLYRYDSAIGQARFWCDFIAVCAASAAFGCGGLTVKSNRRRSQTGDFQAMHLSFLQLQPLRAYGAMQQRITTVRLWKTG